MRRSPALQAALLSATGFLAGCGPYVLARMVDPSNRAITYVLGDDHGQWVEHGRSLDPVHDHVSVASLVVRRGHVAYVAEDGGRFHVVHDGRATSRAFDGAFGVALDDTGGHVAYVVAQGADAFLGFDAFLSRRFDRVDVASIRFASEGKHAMAIAAAGHDRYLVSDDRTEGPFDDVRGAGFAGVVPVFGARRGAAWFLHVGARELGPYDDVASVCTADGPTFGAVVRTDGRARLVSEPSATELRGEAVDGTLVCGDGGGRIGLVERMADGSHRAVIDDTKGPPHARIEPLVLGREHVGYIAHDPGRSTVYIDGHVVAEEPFATGLVLAEHGTGVAYAARRDDHNGIVHDGRFHRFDVLYVDTLVLDGAGEHFACVVEGRRHRPVVTVDGATTLPVREDDWLLRGGGVSPPGQEGMRRLREHVRDVLSGTR